MERDHLFWLAVNDGTKRLKKNKVTLKKPYTKPTINNFAQQMSFDIQKGDGKSFGLEFVQTRKKKNIVIDATLDLHGYTQKQAEEIMSKFIYKNYLLGSSWVRIITGKSGVLFHAVPQFLKTQAQFIGSYTYARQDDGGTGAIYARLRKVKNQT
jgi:DNA-nicking Smr family endonuclease